MRYLFVLALIAATPAVAQPAPADRSAPHLGGTVGIGGGIDESYGGLLSSTFSVDYRRGIGVASLRGLATIGDAFAMADLGLLVGPAYGDGLGRVWFGVGPALTTIAALDPCYGSFFATCDSLYDPGAGGNTLGVAVAFRVYLVEIELLKVGLYGYSNFNTVQDFQGVTLIFQRGWDLR